MLVSELFFLLNELICFFVEGEKVWVELVATITLATSVHHIIRLQGLLQIVPIFLLFPLVIRRIYWVRIVIV